jgi:hypothetical protein
VKTRCGHVHAERSWFDTGEYELPFGSCWLLANNLPRRSRQNDAGSFQYISREIDDSAI